MSDSPKQKPLNQWSRAELMELPRRKWDDESEYDSLLLISTRRKHDSGWAMMAVIGVCKGVPTEIACDCCDDIEWKIPPMSHHLIGQMRTDCAFRSGAIHAWSDTSKFNVGIALSSLEIELTAAEMGRAMG